MEQLLGSFSLGLLLRSLFAGVFFVAAYTAATGGWCELCTITSSEALGRTMAFSLFVGVVAYTFHRSVVYPPIEWGLNSKRASTIRAKWSLISDKTIAVLRDKWDQAAKDGKRTLARSDHLSSWADFAHLQYASAFCIAIGAWSGAAIGDAETCISWPFTLCAVSLFVAALVSDWRLHAVREKIGRADDSVGTD